jgi:hypothetical protein
MRHTQREALIIVGILSTALGGKSLFHGRLWKARLIVTRTALVILLRGYVWFMRRRKQGLDDLFMGIAWVCSFSDLPLDNVTLTDDIEHIRSGPLVLRLPHSCLSGTELV